MHRNVILKKLKKQYPHLDTFPVRPEPLHFSTIDLMAGNISSQKTMHEICEEMFTKKFSNIHRCPKCSNHLKLNEINILAKTCGVFHVGAEVFCPACGAGFRFMLNKDNALADHINRSGGPLHYRGY